MDQQEHLIVEVLEVEEIQEQENLTMMAKQMVEQEEMVEQNRVLAQEQEEVHGNPGGIGYYYDYPIHNFSWPDPLCTGENGTGGLLIIYSNNLNNSGIIESN